MTLVNIVVVLVVAGLLMWLINTYIPMFGSNQELAQHCRVRGRTSVALTGVWRDRAHSRTPHAENQLRTP